ncbi:MAG: protein SanA [Bacteroidetes bacterium]|nr:MAG: protein SanA [Bacteroidota bacterium]
MSRYNIKKLLYIIIVLILTCAGSVLIPNAVITNNAKQKTFTNVQVITKNKVGIVLGTSKYLSNGSINLYYTYRLEAAALLFKAEKINFILASGDNLTSSDELSEFKEDLVKLGVPPEKIYLDYAGFRTLDSMVRSKVIFGQESITIISQKFHNERAIYLAEKFGIKAIGFNAKDVSNRYGRATSFREYFARTKAVFDILINKEPKYLGESIEIN